MNNTSNVNVMLPQSAPPDDQLPRLEQTIRAAVSEALQQKGFAPGRRAAQTPFRLMLIPIFCLELGIQ
jgi:hypothetical protein